MWQDVRLCVYNHSPGQGWWTHFFNTGFVLNYYSRTPTQEILPQYTILIRTSGAESCSSLLAHVNSYLHFRFSSFFPVIRYLMSPIIKQCKFATAVLPSCLLLFACASTWKLNKFCGFFKVMKKKEKTLSVPERVFIISITVLRSKMGVHIFSNRCGECAPL